jgi:RNA-directed DNA polymerase
VLRIKHYFRYADDLVLLSGSKKELHQALSRIKEYLTVNLRLTVKENYQVFPVDARGIDFVGYVFYHTHIRLRKSIKKNFARMMSGHRNRASIASYNGWISHCNGKHLTKKLNGKVQ